MKPFFNKTTLIALLFTSYLISQNKMEIGCETSTSEASVAYIQSIKPQMKTFEQEFMRKQFSKSSTSSKSIQQIPIKVHIIRNSDGSGGLNTYDLENAIENLNDIFSEALMAFHLYEDVNYIDQSDFAHFKKGQETTLMKTDYNPGIINIYFADYIENDSGSSICGYSINKTNTHIIVMKSGCTPNDSTLSHEMGHVFSLMHTHGPSNSKMTTELVNGSNCDTDGDGICDTPADPGLSVSNIDNFCGYTGNDTDANGDVFYPDTQNMMSYSRKACRNHFTPQQYARIYAYFNAEKNGFMQSENAIINEDYSTIVHLNAVSIYPNPATNHNNIYLKGAQEFSKITYQITNLQGQVISTGEVLGGALNIKQLPSGSYLLILSASNAKTVKRFIK